MKLFKILFYLIFSIVCTHVQAQEAVQTNIEISQQEVDSPKDSTIVVKQKKERKVIKDTTLLFPNCIAVSSGYGWYKKGNAYRQGNGISIGLKLKNDYGFRASVGQTFFSNEVSIGFGATLIKGFKKATMYFSAGGSPYAGINAKYSFGTMAVIGLPEKIGANLVVSCGHSKYWGSSSNYSAGLGFIKYLHVPGYLAILSGSAGMYLSFPNANISPKCGMGFMFGKTDKYILSASVSGGRSKYTETLYMSTIQYKVGGVSVGGELLLTTRVTMNASLSYTLSDFYTAYGIGMGLKYRIN